MSESIPSRFHGQCHCGNLSFELYWPDLEGSVPVRACGCDYCQKHGASWTSNPAGKVEFTVRSIDMRGIYEFGHRTARFQFCLQCGIPLAAISTINDRDYAVVNANTFDNLGPLTLSGTPTDFSAEDEASRLARRAQNWTPVE